MVALATRARSMLNLIILILILIGLTVHRYLNSYWVNGILPLSFEFILFANFFAATYLVSLIWMFGFLAGIVVFLLCYLQAVYTAGLWVVLLPGLLSMQRGRSLPAVNPFIYVGFCYLVTGIAVLTIVNFFVSSYRSVWNAFGENIWTVVLVFAGILVVGNVARVAIMSMMLKKYPEDLDDTSPEDVGLYFKRKSLEEQKRIEAFKKDHHSE